MDWAGFLTRFPGVGQFSATVLAAVFFNLPGLAQMPEFHFLVSYFQGKENLPCPDADLFMGLADLFMGLGMQLQFDWRKPALTFPSRVMTLICAFQTQIFC